MSLTGEGRRDSENPNIPSRIPSSGLLSPRLNLKILNVALLRLRFRSIDADKSDPNQGAIPVHLFFPSPLVRQSEDNFTLLKIDPVDPYRELLAYFE